MAALNTAVISSAQIIISEGVEKIKRMLVDEEGMSDDEAEDSIAAEILGFGGAMGANAAMLKSRLPVRLADRIARTTKKPVVTPSGTIVNTKKASWLKMPLYKANVWQVLAIGAIASVGKFLLWLPGQVQQWLDQGTFNPLNANRAMDAMGFPDWMRWPTPTGLEKPGPFSESAYNSYFEQITTAGAVGINNEFEQQTQTLTKENLARLIVLLSGDMILRGKNTSQSSVQKELLNYIIVKKSSETGTTTATTASSGYTSAPVGTVPTQIKIYTGVVANGSLGTPQEFIARPDDMIQNANELKAAAKNNLAALYQALPGRFYYEIAIVASVRTRAGFTIKGAPVQVVSSYTSKGTPRYKTIYHKFAVMRIFVTDRNGRNIKLEEITLGPVNVVDFQPTANQLEKIADAINPETFTGDINEVRQIVTSGSVSVTPTSQYVPAPAPAPAGGTVTPQVSSAYVQQSATVSATPPPAPPPVQASSPAPAPAPVNVQIAKSLPLNEAAGVAFSYGGMGTTTPAAIAARHGVNLEDLYAVNANWGGYGSMRDYTVMDISYLMRNANIPKINIPYPRAGSVAPTSNPQLQAAATLSEAYAALGLSLPALQLRASLYQSWGLGAASTYAGTAEQNNKLLAEIKRRGAVA